MKYKKYVIATLCICTVLCSCKAKTVEEQLKSEMDKHLEALELEEVSEGTYMEYDSHINYTVMVGNGNMYEAVYDKETKDISIEKVGIVDDLFSYESNYTRDDVLELLYENGYVDNTLLLSTLSNHTDNVDVWEVVTRDDVTLYIYMDSGVVEEQD